jgi:hypothetical protein
VVVGHAPERLGRPFRCRGGDVMAVPALLAHGGQHTADGGTGQVIRPPVSCSTRRLLPVVSRSVFQLRIESQEVRR